MAATPEATSVASSNARRPSLLEEVVGLGVKVMVVVTAVVLLFSVVFGLTRYNNENMAPALREGDLVLYDRLDKAYVASDVVVLQTNGTVEMERVVAVAGDTVDMTEAGLVINGAHPVESTIYFPTEPYADGVRYPITLDAGEIFVLSDHRTNAADSRLYGPVQVQETLGTVIAVFRRRNL